MKKFFIAFGLVFALTQTTYAVQYSSIFLSKAENQYFGSIAPCVTQTIHTERIEQDRAGSGQPYISVLRNLERMVRSAEEGCGFQAPKLWAAIDRVNKAVNSGVRIPVYGRSETIMNYFVGKGFRYAGE
jgi:hypothetical protein